VARFGHSHLYRKPERLIFNHKVLALGSPQAMFGDSICQLAKSQLSFRRRIELHKNFHDRLVPFVTAVYDRLLFAELDKDVLLVF
jgi:hypothetical protein